MDLCYRIIVPLFEKVSRERVPGLPASATAHRRESQGERLKARRGVRRQSDGDFYTLNLDDRITREHVRDLEEFGRALGVLAAYEVVEENEEE